MLRREDERKVGALGAGNNTAIASSRWVHLGAYPVDSTFVSTDQNYYGRGIAFAPGQGNLSGIYPGGAFISDVEHKTVVEVNETGTVAVGVTSVGIGTTNPGTGQPRFKSAVLLCNSRQYDCGPVVRRCPDEPGRGLRTVRLWHRLL